MFDLTCDLAVLLYETRDRVGTFGSHVPPFLYGVPMRSEAECLAKSKELSRLGDLTADPDVRAELLAMSELWLSVARMAEWQDAHPSPVA